MDDLKTLIRNAGNEIAQPGGPHYRDGWINIRCPFCNSIKMLLGILPTHGSCFNCGPKKMWDVLLQVCKLDRRQIKEFLKTYKAKPEFHYEQVAENGIYNPPKMGIENYMSAYHVGFLETRRISCQTIQSLWHIWCTGPLGEYKWRFVIPIYFKGTPISWTTRSVVDNDPKRYINAPKERELFPAKSFLFGEDFCGSSISIHEGPLDAITVGPGAVATMGLQYTEVQFARMTKYRKRYVCFDNEPAAQRRAELLVEKLKMFPGSTYNVQLNAKDINEASDKERAEFRKLLK